MSDGRTKDDSGHFVYQ